MTHILIKWKSANKWDVYSVRTLVDEELSCRLCSDPTYIDLVRDKDHLVKWDKNKAAAPVYLLAIGELLKLSLPCNTAFHISASPVKR